MLELTTPRGLPVRVPEDVEEDASPRFGWTQHRAGREYYREHGYVVFENVIGKDVCNDIRRLWETEVKPFSGYMYRQATARAEKHVRNEQGWIMNPILNLQSVDPRTFPNFRACATERILASSGLRDLFAALLGKPPKIVQSMYFEGNSATWEHQDSYYLDCENVGEMTAAWLALEDISPTAGRFFVCPGSHRIKLGDHSLLNNIAENHEAYIQSVVGEIRRRSLDIRAPALKAGDVLFWNSLTIHGSLNSWDPVHGRSSITCHAIPAGKELLQLQSRVLKLKVENVNGAEIHRPKDLASLKNRMIFAAESHFPAQFYWLKKRAILHVLKRKARAKVPDSAPTRLAAGD